MRRRAGPGRGCPRRIGLWPPAFNDRVDDATDIARKDGAMFEAVIWDFGGVFTASPFEAFARFERERGLPENFLRHVNTANHLDNAWARLERAEIDHDTFDELFAAECRAFGREVRGRDVLPLLAGEARPAMVEALCRIHARLKTGCITNNLPAGGGNPMASVYKSDVM